MKPSVFRTHWKSATLGFVAGAVSFVGIQALAEAFTTRERPDFSVAVSAYSNAVDQCIKSRDGGDLHSLKACATAQQRFDELRQIELRYGGQLRPSELRGMFVNELAHRRFEVWKLECQVGFTFDAGHPLNCSEEPDLVTLQSLSGERDQ